MLENEQSAQGLNGSARLRQEDLMRILLTIVHHWNPKGGGRHASLRADPKPRLHALQDQLLSLARLGTCQGTLNIAEMRVDNASHALRHQFTIRLVTDGQHHLADELEDPYQPLVEHVATQPTSAKHLGFEAQRILAENLDKNFDLYGYLEDDLIIHDPLFFHKIFWFQQHIGADALLLPHRMELFWAPDHQIEKLYIDGPVPEEDRQALLAHPAQPVAAPLPGGNIVFAPPDNPHAGCFFLSHQQLRHWSEQPWFLDEDCSYVSPLESAATLGICKTFRIYKPHLAYASFLELQHWGTTFRSLIGKSVAPLS